MVACSSVHSKEYSSNATVERKEGDPLSEIEKTRVAIAAKRQEIERAKTASRSNNEALKIELKDLINTQIHQIESFLNGTNDSSDVKNLAAELRQLKAELLLNESK